MHKVNFSKLQTDSQKLSLFGSTIQITTKFDDQVEGTIFYYDEEFIILKNQEELSMFNCEYIKDIKYLSTEEPQLSLDKILHQAQIQTLNDMMTNSTEQQIEQEKKKVQSKQNILFEHLLKMYKDTIMEGSLILIPSLRITISDPFDADSCQIDPQQKKGQGLERVKKMVTKLWENRIINE